MTDYIMKNQLTTGVMTSLAMIWDSDDICSVARHLPVVVSFASDELLKSLLAQLVFSFNAQLQV
jgi:hypothetical protein